MAATRIARAVIEGGIYGLLLLPPLCFGGVQGWARGVIQIVAGAIVLARLVEARGGEPSARAMARRPALMIGVPAGLFVALVFFQLAPLPPSLLKVVSPGAHRLYSASVPGYMEGETLRAADLPSWLLDRPKTRVLLGWAGSGTQASRADQGGSPFDGRFSSWRTATIVPYETGRRLGLLLSCLAVFAVAAVYFRTRDRIDRLAATMVISAAGASALTILARLGWLAGESRTSLLGPIVNRNTFAAFVGATLPVAVSMTLAAFGERRPQRGFLWGLASVLLSGALFTSMSRAGILSAAVSLVALSLLVVYYERRVVTVVTLAALMAAGALMLVWLGPDRVLERLATVSQGSSEPSLAHRIDVWRRALHVVGDYPGVGAGLGTFAYAFMRHAPPEETWWRTAHNEYLELICDTGLLGGLLAAAALAAYLAMMGRPGRLFGRDERFVMIGMAPGLLSLAIHSTVSANMQVPAVALLGAALAGALLAAAAGPSLKASTHRPGGVLKGTTAILLVGAVALNTLWGAAAIAGYFHREAGEESLARAEMDSALESFTEAIFWQPGDSRTYELMARMVELSLTNGLTLSSLGEKEPDAVLGFGLGAIAAGLDRNPGSSRTWFALATLYQGRRIRRELAHAVAPPPDPAGPSGGIPAPEDPVSIGAILQAQDLQPEFTAYHDYLAGVLRRGGLLEAASDQLRRSFRLRPHLEGHALIDLEESGFLASHGEAILEGIAAAEPDPFTSSIMAARSRALLLEKMGRIDEAIRAYAELRVLGGVEFEAQFHLASGRLEQQRGNYLDSIPKLEAAAKAGKGTSAGAWANYHLGVATSRAGQHTAAIRYYRTFLALKPDHVSAWTGLAGELDLVGQTEEAERLYGEAVRLFPEEPEAYEKIIVFLERQSREAEVEPFREKLLRLAP